MFGLGKKRKINQEIAKKDLKQSPATLLLLSNFRKGSSKDRFREDDEWRSALGASPENVIDQLINEGMLEPAELPELASFKFKVSDLKSMLKEKGIKTSGNKAHLIQLLIENDATAMSKATENIELLRCTPEGLELANKYLQSEKQKRESIEQEVMNLLTQKEFSKAVNRISQFEASQVFQRGMGIDWNNYDETTAIKSLKSIFKETPAILKQIDKTRLDHLRVAAAMMELWGTSSANSWLEDGFETGIHLDAETCCRMFVFYSAHLHSIKEFKRSGIRKVEILSAGDNRTCPECQKISDKKYSLNKVPELPYAKCTCDDGCRCVIVAGDF